MEDSKTESDDDDPEYIPPLNLDDSTEMESDISEDELRDLEESLKQDLKLGMYGFTSNISYNFWSQALDQNSSKLFTLLKGYLISVYERGGVKTALLWGLACWLPVSGLA